VQTLQPRHPAIVRAAEHDYDGFAATELAERRRFGWPPATRLVRALVTSRDAAAARSRAEEVGAAATAALPPGGGDVLGPTPCPIARQRDRYRFHAVVRAADRAVQHAVCLRLQRFSRRAGGTELTLDVDPVDLT